MEGGGGMGGARPAAHGDDDGEAWGEDDAQFMEAMMARMGGAEHAAGMCDWNARSEQCTASRNVAMQASRLDSLTATRCHQGAANCVCRCVVTACTPGWSHRTHPVTSH